MKKIKMFKCKNKIKWPVYFYYKDEISIIIIWYSDIQITNVLDKYLIIDTGSLKNKDLEDNIYDFIQDYIKKYIK